MREDLRGGWFFASIWRALLVLRPRCEARLPPSPPPFAGVAARSAMRPGMLSWARRSLLRAMIARRCL
jgi:hypothetical protein